MLRLTCCLLTLALLLALPGTGVADIYVNNEFGSNFYNGISPTTSGRSTGPVRTIERALKIVEAGERVVLAKTETPYRESISLVGYKNSGDSLGAFEIRGNGAVLDGTVAIDDRDWKTAGGSLFRFRPRWLAHQQLYSQGQPLKRVKVNRQALTVPKLKALEWCLFDGYLYFRTEEGKVPSDYAPRCAGLRTGITLYRVERVTITGLTIQGFQLDGINAADGAKKVQLTGLTLRGNGRSGVSVCGASRVTVSQCLIGNNGEAQVRTEGISTTRVQKCDVLDNTAPSYQVDGGKLFIDGKPFQASESSR